MTTPLSEADFRSLLDFERACAAREGRCLSVLLFDVERSPSDDGRSAPVVRAAAQRLRSTDAIGWLGPKQLGIALPDTPESEAERIGAELASRASGDADGISGLHADVRHFPAPHARLRPRRRPESPQRPTRLAPVRPSLDPAGVFSLLADPLPRWKRVLDVLLAAGGLVVFAPLMLLVALGVRATSRGPVIYRQERTGHALHRFHIYKFRTMRRGSHRQQGKLRHMNQMTGPLFKTDADPRLTWVGGLLRRTSLDELPQLVNVLKGEMTLLGPRALSPPASAYEPWQLRRFSAVPGVACTWQAERRGETDFTSWIRSDLAYVDRGPSLPTDLRLLVKTVLSVLTCAGGR